MNNKHNDNSLTNFHKFQIKKLFNIEKISNNKTFLEKHARKSNGNNPYRGSSKLNNGIICYTSLESFNGEMSCCK
jgi:hypothetical protein